MQRKKPSSSVRALTAERQFALSHLLEAFQTAQELGDHPSAFACQLETLTAIGISETTLRWLGAKGFLDHHLEVTKPSQKRRRFRRSDNFRFCSDSCFRLTKSGVAFAESLASRNRLPLKPADKKRRRIHPHYDAHNRILFFKGRKVKELRVPAPNQELILKSFEEVNWREHMHDPLPPRANVNAKQRLHDTIKRLNRSHLFRAIHFEGDGTGCGIRWKVVGPKSAPDRP
jgi:hypothetical protein